MLRLLLLATVLNITGFLVNGAVMLMTINV